MQLPFSFFFVIGHYACSIWARMGNCLQFGQIWPRQRFEYHDRNAGHLITRLLEHKHGMREERAITCKFPYFIYSIAYCTSKVSHQDAGKSICIRERDRGGGSKLLATCLKSDKLTESIEAKAEAGSSHGRSHGL